ncbi:MAG: hypothetical protein EOS23_26500 [Mesorhizobium sp.]|nr:MAG: hypothetical protein EOS23_26500 [Mesorhizobium sp.]
MWKDSIGLLGSVARAAGPWIAAAGALYSAYKLIGSFSAEASLGIDKTTAALAKQAAPLGALESQIGELSRIQDAYSKSLVSTGDVHRTMTDQIVADAKREFDAKKQLLELEEKRQQASIAVQQSEIAITGLGLKKAVGQQVFTRSDLERQGFADPRINGGIPFVRLPDEITGLGKTRDVLENNPLSDKIKELRANLELTELGAQKLQEALKKTFSDAGGVGGPTFAGGNIPIPQFRGIDDMPGYVEVYEDLIKSGKARILQMQQERDGLGLVGGAAASLRFEQEALNAAIAKNVELSPAQVAAIRAQAAEYGRLSALTAAQTAILGQEQNLELQRAELALVGESASVHDRAIANLKAEQQIRQLGIDLYGKEAEAIRANTAELSALADASAKAKLQKDLAFERDQMFRSTQDQAIASRQQGAGLAVDLNSPAAQQMRHLARFADAKGLAVGFLTDFKSELMRNGGDVGEALGESIICAYDVDGQAVE